MSRIIASVLLSFIGLANLSLASVDVYCPHSQLCIHPPIQEAAVDRNGITIKRVMAIPVSNPESQIIEIRLKENMYWDNGDTPDIVKAISVQSLPEKVSYCTHNQGCQSLLMVGVRTRKTEKIKVVSPWPSKFEVSPLEIFHSLYAGLTHTIASEWGNMYPLFKYSVIPSSWPENVIEKDTSARAERKAGNNYFPNQSDETDSDLTVNLRTPQGYDLVKLVAQPLMGRIMEESVFLFFYGLAKQFFFIPVPSSQINFDELLVMSDEMLLSDTKGHQPFRVDLTPLQRVVPVSFSELGPDSTSSGLKAGQIVTRVTDQTGEPQYIFLTGEQMLMFTSVKFLLDYLRQLADYEEWIDSFAEFVCTYGFNRYTPSFPHKVVTLSKKKKKKNPGSDTKFPQKYEANKIMISYPDSAEISVLNSEVCEIFHKGDRIKNSIPPFFHYINPIGKADLKEKTQLLKQFLQPSLQDVVVGIVFKSRQNQYLDAIRSPGFLAVLRDNANYSSLIDYLFHNGIISEEEAMSVNESGSSRAQAIALHRLLQGGSSTTAYNFAEALEATSHHSGHRAILQYLNHFRSPSQSYFVSSTRVNPLPTSRAYEAAHYRDPSAGAVQVSGLPLSTSPHPASKRRDETSCLTQGGITLPQLSDSQSSYPLPYRELINQKKTQLVGSLIPPTCAISVPVSESIEDENILIDKAIALSLVESQTANNHDDCASVSDLDDDNNENQVECEVCLNSYPKAMDEVIKSLACQSHTVCQDCLQQHIQYAFGLQGVVLCPGSECKTVIPLANIYSLTGSLDLVKRFQEKEVAAAITKSGLSDTFFLSPS